MSEVTTVVGQPVSVQSLPVADVPAPDDYLVLDGPTEGTRRILASGLVSRLESRLQALEERLVALEDEV
jgi:hypothetical protein